MIWTNVPWLGMGALVVTGAVPSTLDFLLPARANGYVDLWFGCMAALLALGTYWALGRGGAELLSKHPGTPMVPRLSARGTKWFWVGGVVWNVVGGVLLYAFSGSIELGSRPSVPHTPSATAPDASGDVAANSLAPWFVLLFMLAFACMWIGVGFVIARTGGWSRLAERYRCDEKLRGRWYRFRSARMGSANYGGVLNFGVNEDALSIRTVLLFRAGHAPLTIPWQDVRFEPFEKWLSSGVELTFAQVPGVSIRISNGLARRLRMAAVSGEI